MCSVTVLERIIVAGFPLQVCCSVLQCVAMCCSVLLCVAVCCSVLHCDYVVVCVAVRCIMLPPVDARLFRMCDMTHSYV